MENRNQIVPNWVILGTAVLLCAAVIDLPDDFYRLLRWIISAASIGIVIESSKSNQKNWAWISALIALVYNPFFSFEFDLLIWRIINLLVASIFCVRLYSTTKSNYERYWRIVLNIKVIFSILGVLCLGVFIHIHRLNALEKNRLRVTREYQIKTAVELAKKNAEYEEQRKLRKKSQEEAEILKLQELAVEIDTERRRLENIAEREEKLKLLPQSFTEISLDNLAYKNDYKSLLSGELTNNLTKPINKVSLKVSLFKVIAAERRYEKDVGYITVKEGREELITVERVVIHGIYLPKERKKFGVKIPVSGLEYGEYVARAEVTAASFTE